jgi:ElaB/YqjD/DUF883 family membrane-anchored ribosome-binding protein
VSDEGLDKAKDEASAARERLFATAQEIQNRLEPSSLLDDAVGTVREQSARIARTASDSIRERPAAFGAAAAAGALLIVHRPLIRFARRLFGRSKETEDAAAG